MLQLHLFYSSDSSLDVLVPKFIQKLSLSFEKLEQCEIDDGKLLNKVNICVFLVNINVIAEL